MFENIKLFGLVSLPGLLMLVVILVVTNVVPGANQDYVTSEDKAYIEGYNKSRGN